MVRSGTMSKEQFDGWFSELIRKELGKVLAIMRAKAVQKARGAGAGSASSAVLRRMYKNRFGGNVNIAENNRRISNRKRLYSRKCGPSCRRPQQEDINEVLRPRSWFHPQIFGRKVLMCARQNLTDPPDAVQGLHGVDAACSTLILPQHEQRHGTGRAAIRTDSQRICGDMDRKRI